jgi:hypothetical protein
MLYLARYDGTTGAGMAIVSAGSEEEVMTKVNQKFRETNCPCVLEVHTIIPLQNILFEEQGVILISLLSQTFVR